MDGRLDLDGGVAIPDVDTRAAVVNGDFGDMERALLDVEDGLVLFAGFGDYGGLCGFRGWDVRWDPSTQSMDDSNGGDNENAIATPSPPHLLVTNTIVVNGDAAAVPLPPSAVALPLFNTLRFSDEDQSII